MFERPAESSPHQSSFRLSSRRTRPAAQLISTNCSASLYAGGEQPLRRNGAPAFTNGSLSRNDDEKPTDAGGSNGAGWTRRMQRIPKKETSDGRPTKIKTEKKHPLTRKTGGLIAWAFTSNASRDPPPPAVQRTVAVQRTEGPADNQPTISSAGSGSAIGAPTSASQR